MVRRMHDSTAAPERVRTRFEERAHQFDDLYEDERWLVRTLRPGLFRRRQLAVDTVKSYSAPARARRRVWLGADRRVRPRCRRRPLRRRRFLRADDRDVPGALNPRFADKIELIVDDFLTAPVNPPFDVILAVGLFDYLPDAERFCRRMFDLTAPGGCVVGSFPAWSWLKGPVRKVRYEWIGNCPIFNYGRRELERMFGASGFGRRRDRDPRPQRLPGPRVPDLEPGYQHP